MSPCARPTPTTRDSLTRAACHSVTMATALERRTDVCAQPWSAAWTQASNAFWSSERPESHFRTSAGPIMARYIVFEIESLAVQVLDDLTVIDIGAGGGELLGDVARLLPQPLRDRVHLIGVDVRCPVGDTSWISARVPGDLGVAPVTGIVMAHEWLDEIACDVAIRHGECDYLLLVDTNGNEQRGPDLRDDAACARLGVDAAAARDWLARWWPLREDGDRAEIGIARDEAWQWMTSLLGRGVALASDYAHDREARLSRYRKGTLAGYRHGRLVRPAADGCVNLTAHVAADACAATVPGTACHRQRDILSAPIPLPPASDSMAYAEALSLRSARAMLRDPNGPGSFTWLRWER